MSTQLNYLIFSQYYYPDITAAAFRIKETADILISKGSRVTVITAEPHKAQVITRDNLDDGKVNVIRVPIIKIGQNSKWGYFIHYGSYLLMSMVATIFNARNNYDVVIASSPPLFIGLAGYILGKIKKALFVLDIRDIWPDTAVVAGQIQKESKLYKYGVKLEKWLYKNCQLITCVSKPMAEHICNYVSQDKIIVIYNGASEAYLNIEGQNHSGINLIKDKINITYLGNMGYLQNLQTVIESARIIKDTDIDTIIYLIGGGVEKDKLRQLIKKYGLNNVIIGGPVKKYEAIQIMKESLALFIQLKDDATMEKTIPSKVFDYMVAGKPILFGIRGEGKDILEQVKGNIFYKPDSVESFIEAVRKLKKNYKQLSEDAIMNRAILEQQYTRERMVDKFVKYLQELN